MLTKERREEIERLADDPEWNIELELTAHLIIRELLDEIDRQQKEATRSRVLMGNITYNAPQPPRP